MEKSIKGSQTLMISHVSDNDGIGSAVLAFLAFGEIDYLLVENNEINIMYDFLRTADYQQIFICDLGLPEDIGMKINELSKPILLFDHHVTSIGINQFAYATVEVELNGRKTCGTELFYEHLIHNQLIESTPAIIDFVEATRGYDTWDWQKDNNLLANDLSVLFKIMGPIEYLNTFTDYLKKNEYFGFSKEQQMLIDVRKKEIAELSIVCQNAMMVIELDGLKGGLVFCDRYASTIGNDMCLNQAIDFAILIDLLEDSVSLRSVGSINVGTIAKKFGGGGHQNAAGFPLTKENKQFFFKLVLNELNK